MQRLKILREAKRISQQKLAIDLNISQGSISKYEGCIAEPDIKSIIRLSKYFNVTTDYLLGNSDKKYAIEKKELTDEEIEVIFDYRKLDTTKKLKFRAYLDGLVDCQK